MRQNSKKHIQKPPPPPTHLQAVVPTNIIWIHSDAQMALKWPKMGGWIVIRPHCNCLPIQMMNLSDAGVTYLIIATNLFLELLKLKLPQTKRCTYHLLFFLATTIKKLDFFFLKKKKKKKKKKK